MGRHRAPDDSGGFRVRFMTIWKKYQKSIVAAIGAGVSTIYAVYTGGITQEEWIFIGFQVLAAAGVYKFPNVDKEKDKNANV